MYKKFRTTGYVKMADYQIIYPRHSLLVPYVDHYMYVSGRATVNTKQILPRPGASMVFDFSAPFCFGGKSFQKALSGLQFRPFIYGSEAEFANHLVVHFSPYGLSRFIDGPVDEMTGHIITPELLLGGSVDRLYQQAGETDLLDRRIDLVETFLIKRYTPPLEVESGIFAIADRLRAASGSEKISQAREEVSLSRRQIERRFKAIIGVDMQSFVRISRFERAKRMILQNPSLRLTDVGLEAGYYDQPHFSNDFKQLSGVSPRRYEHCI